MFQGDEEKGTFNTAKVKEDKMSMASIDQAA